MIGNSINFKKIFPLRYHFLFDISIGKSKWMKGMGLMEGRGGGDFEGYVLFRPQTTLTNYSTQNLQFLGKELVIFLNTIKSCLTIFFYYTKVICFSRKKYTFCQNGKVKYLYLRVE